MKMPFPFLQRTLATALPILTWCGGTCVATENQAVIDVLMVFDQTASEHIRQAGTIGGVFVAPMNEEQTAELAINQLNRVLVKSGIDKKVKFRNAGVHRSSYRTTTLTNGRAPEDAPSDLAAMRFGKVEGLEEARERTNADLVVLFTYYPITGAACVGGAIPLELNSLYMPTEKYEEIYRELGSKEGFATSFNVLTIRTKDTTFSHEVCHLLGAGHSDAQLRQSGPQSEMDAAGCYPGSNAYASLMSYSTRLDPTDNLKQKSSQELEVLSHPGKIKVDGAELTMGDEKYHNNAAVVVRHASAVAAFRLSGREKVINDSPEEALPMPVFVPFREKLERLLWGQFYSLFVNGVLPKWIIKEMLEKGESPDRFGDLETFIAYIWTKRQEYFRRMTYEDAYGFRSYFMDSEFMRHQPEENYISCTFGTTVNATKESGEPVPTGGTGKTVWYKVETPCDGDLEVAVRHAITTKGFRPAMGIYFGSQKTRFQQLTHKDTTAEAGGSFLKSISANVPGNTPLYIAVDSEQGSQPGNFCLVVRHKKGSYSGAPLKDKPADDKPADDKPADDKPEWDATDSVLVGLCGVFFLSSLVLGYLLWMQSYNKRKIQDGTDTPEKPGQNNLPTPLHTPQTPPVPVPHTPAAPGFTLHLEGRLSNGEAASYNIDLREVRSVRNYYIGRDATLSQTVIRDATVSKCHAVLKIRRDEKGELLLLGDAGSTNGTWVDGTLLRKDECVKVKNDQTVVLGKCTFRISQF